MTLLGFLTSSFPSLAASGKLSGQALAHFPPGRLRPRGEDAHPNMHTPSTYHTCRAQRRADTRNKLVGGAGEGSRRQQKTGVRAPSAPPAAPPACANSRGTARLGLSQSPRPALHSACGVRAFTQHLPSALIRIVTREVRYSCPFPADK